MSDDLPEFVAPLIGAEKLPDAIAYLKRKRTDLAAFHDVEDLATAEPERKDLLHFFGIVKSALAKKLEYGVESAFSHKARPLHLCSLDAASEPGTPAPRCPYCAAPLSLSQTL